MDVNEVRLRFSFGYGNSFGSFWCKDDVAAGQNFTSSLLTTPPRHGFQFLPALKQATRQRGAS